ncbi:MAG: AAA family ATPase [Scytonematopsis contorta HA4267-MV1]|jgi:predicted ATPase/signal transduction histidine kinase/DNA-binding response OmpR family regulator|nr:AAA family ATPase [Scytonematopsis contorta HA4267-MV1]
MITLPGYRVTDIIYEGSKTLIFRGERESDQLGVKIKLLKAEYPTLRELVQLRNQYAIAKNLNLPGIVKIYSLLDYRNGFALVMEDFEGITLKQLMEGEKKQLPITNFLQIAIQVVSTLEGLHNLRIIHKDIKPQHILINPPTSEAKLIDFGIASLLPKEKQEIESPEVLEGTLSYMSPEQTGRMNRGIDYRTDFYSLGITFYELLTGQLPFVSADAMELVHCHIARKPTPPIKLNPEIPQVLNDIVLKLMAKTTEQRYQSTLGIKYDLEKCLEEQLTTNNITYFHLGSRDIYDRFQIQEKLYGRETEVATLLAAFERVSAGATELMLVAGFSGIGKTALVNEVHKPIVRQRGYFIKGKFDQFQRNIPFSALVQAFQNLMRQLLTESNTQVEKWKSKIIAALGDNAQVIISVIPELERIIGEQPALSELEASAAENRFRLLFQKFIRVFTYIEHPLVIFLDDLQWADSASLKLIQILMAESSTGSLLLIGAYRDNEVLLAHPLMLTLENIRVSTTVNQITLAPLSKTALNNLIADTLNCSPEIAIPLTEEVFRKTQGNPFFSNQFLYSLYQDGLIFFDLFQPSDREKIATDIYGGWQCDIAKVRTLSVSSDIVEFMAYQLRRLPEETQDLLKLAACIGNQFDLTVLAIVWGKSQTETAAVLWKALQEGFILPTSQIYKFFQEIAQDISPGLHQEDSAINIQKKVINYSDNITANYKFLHDRVQQAAYSLIPENEKQSTHLKIGKLLLENTPHSEQEEKIFEIVNQLNFGVNLITDLIEKNKLAQLNLVAAKKARASTAYDTAVEYSKVGMELLPLNSWQTQYELTLALHETAAEVRYLTGDFSQMETLVDIVLQKAHHLLDKIKSYEIKIQSYTAQSQPLKAVISALSVLQLLGINFPLKPSKLQILLVLVKTNFALLGKKIEDLIDLPKMTDPHQLAAFRIMRSMSSSTYNSVPEIMPLLVLKVIYLSVKYGNASQSAYGYASYGVILCGVMGDIDAGYRFSKLGLKLLEKLSAKEFKSETFMVVHNFINHWKNHLREGLEPLLEAYQAGLEAGNLEFAAFSAYIRCYHCLLLGEELNGLEQEMFSYTQAVAQFKQEATLSILKLYRQVVLNLLGQSENPCLLIGKAYNENMRISLAKQANYKTEVFDIHFHKLILCYLFEQYSQALENSEMAAEYLDVVIASPSIPLFYFYDSLIRLALYPSVSKSKQKSFLRKVVTSQKKIKKWAHFSPMNHLHKFYLVEAERHKILGQYTQAIENYHQSITLAKENGYLNEESLANELAAKFYLAWGKSTIAQAYLTQAYYCYARWGAKAKIDDLEKLYPELLSHTVNIEPSHNKSEELFRTVADNLTYSSPNGSEILDLETVIKVSQAAFGEMQLERLLSTLMKVLIENAGAEKGTLILIEEENKIIAAQYTTTTNETQDGLVCNLPITYSQVQDSQTQRDIPLTLINYVEHTQEILVINDISAETTFAGDPYIIENQPKSVLCTPIVKQGKLIGILYLENNFMKGAFTSNRLTIIQILTSQAAISLENARLYERIAEYSRTLEVKVEQRTEELQQLTEKLQQAVIAADAANRAKSEFLANMSHELRTPLNVILGFSQLMSHDDDLSKEQQENLEYINRAGKHLLELINDILELSKIEAGQSSLSENSFDLINMLDSLENILRFKAESQGLQFKFEYDANIPKYIKTDEIKLRQILINLLGNAIKFTEQGSVNLRVSLVEEKQVHNTRESQLTHLLFQVEDTGIGIFPEEINLLFTPFGQTKSGRNQQGTGLGLRISRKYVQMMGGDIKVKSVPAKGSLFQFDIKLHSADINEIHDIVIQNKVIGLANNQLKYRILVADDSSENRLMLVKLLTSIGFSVREAENGQRVVDLWSNWQPHLIFMDMRMPIMDGYEATKLIKSRQTDEWEQKNNPHDNTKHQTIIIALTASAFDEQRQVILSVGCDDLIHKPFSEEALLEKISQYLGVEYIYQEKNNKTQGKIQKNKETLTDEDLINHLSQIPADLLEKIHNAACQGSDDLMVNLISEIPNEYFKLASNLTELTRDFQFEKIIGLIQTKII